MKASGAGAGPQPAGPQGATGERFDCRFLNNFLLVQRSLPGGQKARRWRVCTVCYNASPLFFPRTTNLQPTCTSKTPRTSALQTHTTHARAETRELGPVQRFRLWAWGGERETLSRGVSPPLNSTTERLRGGHPESPCWATTSHRYTQTHTHGHARHRFARCHLVTVWVSTFVVEERGDARHPSTRAVAPGSRQQCACARVRTIPKRVLLPRSFGRSARVLWPRGRPGRVPLGSHGARRTSAVSGHPHRGLLQ